MALAAVVGASVLLAASVRVPAGAADQTARAKRAQVRAEQARVASQVDALQSEQPQVAAALGALDENVRGQQAVLADAQRQLEDSTAEADRAEAAVVKLTAKLDAVRARVVAYSVEAYVEPPDEDLLRRFEAADVQEDATRRALLEMRSGRDADSVDSLRATRQRLDEERQRAVEARALAEQAAAEATQATEELTRARDQQAVYAEQVRSRLDDRLADAAYLSKVDADLGQRIAAEEAALARALASVPAKPKRATGGSSGRGATGSAASDGRSVAASRPDLVTVGDITVAASIGDQLRQLLAAAQADGISLSGSGWRDGDNQVGLRGMNCGWSRYQLYEMPPDQCSPPTARPGSSLHEQGLAIDFSVNGKYIESRSSAPYRWLAANAGRFGFSNLPSEPWHWSTTGG